MSLWKIAWRSIQQRALASGLTGLSMALGVTLVVAVLVVHSAISRSFNSENGLGYDLIVGAKGGKLQLVLNTVFHLSSPVENIPYSYYKEFASGQFKPYVAQAIPVCMGDTYRDFRVVGTTPEMFSGLEYAYRKKFQFAEGGNFKQDDFFSAVIGSVVAQKTGLRVGSKFEPTHGAGKSAHKHDDSFTVVGVLKPTGTPSDRGLFVNMEGFYLLDNHALPIETEGADVAAAAVEQAEAVVDAVVKQATASAAPGLSQAASEAAHDDHAHHDHDHDQEQSQAVSTANDTESVEEHQAHEHSHGDGAHEHDHADEEKHAAEHVINTKPADDHPHEHGEGEHDHAHADEKAENSTHGEDQHDHSHEDAGHDHGKEVDDHGHVGPGDDHAHDDHADAHGDHAHGDHDHAHGDHDHGDHDHGHHHHKPLPEEQREVTAVLVLTQTYPGMPPGLLAPEIIKKVNKGQVAQAVLPIREIRNLFDVFVTPIQLVLLSLTVLICIVSGISILVSIYNSMSERRHEIAVMRALGASRGKVMLIVLLESVLLSLAGGVFGFLLGHGLIAALNPWITAQTGVSIGFFRFVPYELVIIPGLVLLAALVGFLPALAAYRTDVAKALTAAP